MAQLQLDLWQVELDALPWQGRNPRGLTKSQKVLFLRPEPQKADRFFVDPFQYDMFPEAMKGSHQYGGAPLLLPF